VNEVFFPDSSLKPVALLNEKNTGIEAIREDLPIVETSQIIKISKHLLAAQEKLASESIYSIVDWIDEAAEAWLNPESEIRLEAESRLPAAYGLSKAMICFILDDLFKQLRRPLLLQFLQEELGDPKRLDGFQPKERGVGLSRAFGPRLIAHILPGNIPGTAVASLVLGLLAKSANLARLSQSARLLTELFARSLQAIRPELAETIALLSWPSDQVSLTVSALSQADLAVIYGSDATISSLRQITPPSTRLISYGHKLSLGVIARESADKNLSERVAQDVALYDQRGCLSPQLYYVESGGAVSPLEFSACLAEALDVLSTRLPKGETSPLEAARIQQLRGTMALKGGRAFSSTKGLAWTVLYDPDPEFSPSPLSRTIWIKAVDDLSEVPSHLRSIRKSLQAIGIACPKPRQAALVTSLAQLGGCRMCPIGKMQMPPLSWHHDGQPRLSPLLRFVDWEKS